MNIFLLCLVLLQVEWGVRGWNRQITTCHHPYQVKCNDCLKCVHSARMKDCLLCCPKKTISEFSIKLDSYGYNKLYDKKQSKYDWQNIYSYCIFDFSWIKNPTIIQNYSSNHGNHSMCGVNCDVKRKEILRSVRPHLNGR